jgi:hypothetical protein
MGAAPAARAHVSFDLPANPQMWTVARMGVSAVAAQLDFSINDLEDLRLAVNELLSSCAAGALEKSRMLLECSWDDHEIEITCDVTAIDPNASDGAGDLSEIDLSRRILEALVDAHAINGIDAGSRHGWFRKARESTGG